LKQQGHDIVGAYMKNWINEDKVIGHCPWMQDIEDARAVADRLGIEFRVVNLMDDYRRLVVDYLLDGYQRGLTPNPDVMCNREMKFGVFAKYAQAEGFAAVATGHYARRVRWSSISTSTTGAGVETGAHLIIRAGVLLLPPHALLLLLAFLLEPGLLVGHLLPDLVGVVELLRAERGVELLLEEDLPLRGLALVDAVDLRKASLLLRAQRCGGGFALGEAFHGEFVGAFHGALINHGIHGTH